VLRIPDIPESQNVSGMAISPDRTERMRFIPATPENSGAIHRLRKKPTPALTSEQSAAEAGYRPAGGGTSPENTGDESHFRKYELPFENGRHPVPVPEQRLNAYEEKILHYQESLCDSQNDPAVWTDIGNLSMKTGRYQQAAEAFRQALDLADGDSRVWNLLGDAQRKRGLYEDAGAAYDRSLDLDPGAGPVWISRAKTFAMLGKYNEAIDACGQAIQIDENDVDAWLYKGFLLKKVSRHSEALNVYDRVLIINPENDQALRQRKILSDCR
jgi:tetratricopeptide (TPR) repeat protein